MFRLAYRQAEGLVEKHGTATRRSWRTLHLGAGAGRIVAATLASKDTDDAPQAAPLLDQATIGSSLRARILPVEKTEAKVACSALSRMAKLGMLVIQRVRRKPLGMGLYVHNPESGPKPIGVGAPVKWFRYRA